MNSSMEDFEKSERRQRKKKLINEVKDLLEFYFSPANLKKDNFMINLLKEDCYIDLNVFHRFNKVKQLTDQTQILQKAVSNSDVLELSEDKMKVKRKLPVVMKENEMECTIYVENLPPNATHEWLKKVFSIYGTIDYISLPKFPNSGLHKGFAFIEYQTEEESQQAIFAFGGLASLDGTLNPGDLLSIKSYGKDFANTNAVPKLDPNAEVFVPNPIKRTADEAFGKDEDDLPDEEASTSQATEEGTEGKKKKKKRKRDKKEKEYELDSIYLRVMSKYDWKSLRNSYLDAQKGQMKQLKYDIGDHYSKQIHGQYPMKFTEHQEQSTSSSRPEYLPNLIVKLTLSDELKNEDEFRQGLKTNRSEIAYVDLKEGETVVHIRFKSEEGATQFLAEGLFPNVELIKGDEESCYWSRIFTLWELNKMKNKKKKAYPFVPDMKRGRDKIVSRALSKGYARKQNQHTVFE